MADPHLFSVTDQEIATAVQHLAGAAHLTPVLTSRTLDQLVGSLVFLKCENFQRTGSFKFRGAYNALSQLSDSQKQRGVLTYSSGNHGQAIALAGQILGITTTVLMPSDAPAVKQEATEGYGAEVSLFDRATTDRNALSQELVATRGLTLIPPYDHPWVIAGQGTAAKELIETVDDLDILLVPCGGGGLLSGCAIAAHALAPNCRVIGVEPAAADDATRSFRTKILQTVYHPQTIADGARTPSLGEITFPLVLHYVHDMVTVSEQSIVTAMRFLWERLKIVVEPTGALGIAALLEWQIDYPQCKIGVIITGGNVNLPDLGVNGNN